MNTWDKLNTSMEKHTRKWYFIEREQQILLALERDKRDDPGDMGLIKEDFLKECEFVLRFRRKERPVVRKQETRCSRR